MSLPEDIPSLVRTLVETACASDVFERMSLTDKRNLQMLIVFEFLLERQYAQGINALLPAKDICAKTTVGIGWGQVGATRGALAKAILHMRVPTSLSEDNETLRRAADLVIQELVALNGGAPSSSFSS